MCVRPCLTEFDPVFGRFGPGFGRWLVAQCLLLAVVVQLSVAVLPDYDYDS